MTDPFAGQAATAGPTATVPPGDPFGTMQGDDPFSPLAGGGNFGPAPRFADLGGRLLALHIREIEERQKYRAAEGIMESTGYIDIGVLDGGIIMAPPSKEEKDKQPFGAPPLPMVECGMPPMVFPRRLVSAKGVLNKFGAVKKIKVGKEGKEERFILTDNPRGSVILGRLGKLVSDKEVAKYLGIELGKSTEADLVKVADWLATNPTDEQLKQANVFWTLVEPSEEARAAAVTWVREHPEFLA